MFEVSYIVVILLVTTVINSIATIIAWQRRKGTRSGLYFALGMAGITFWTLAAGLDYAAVPVPLKVFFATLEAWGYMTAIPFFLLCAMSFAGYDRLIERRWFKALIIFVPASDIMLVSTNGLHGWVWKGFIQSADNIVIFEHGPAFNWIVFNGYLMILGIIVTLWIAIRRGSDITRRQGYLLLGAALFPLMTNVVYNFLNVGPEGVDWTSVTFSITGLLFLQALYGMRFLDLVPIARDRLVAGLSDGMIVLDMHDRIIDINHVAAGMVGSPSENLIGKKLVDVAPLVKSLPEQPLEQEVRMEFEVEGVDKRYFDVLASPLREKNKTIVGRLIIFRDITARKKNELRLLQLTQAVEQSPASVVVTDPMGVIEYVNPRFSRLTGYSYDEAIGKNPNILKSGHTKMELYRDMWQTIQAGKVWQGEFLNKKKNGELYWEQTVMAPVLDRGGNIINFIAVKEDITERKQTEADLERRFLEIQELHRDLQETQAQLVEQQRTLAALDERRRLGRDMHDSVNQSIHSLMLFSETLIALLENDQPDEAIHIAERIHESGGQALKEIRLLVYETQSPLVDENVDLLSALEERLNMVERRVGIKAEILCEDGSMEYCPPGWKENLYWMVMEALNNSLKHAKARNVSVAFQGGRRQLKVEIKDNGAGFGPGQVRSGGFGMRTMRERAGLLGGELSVESSPGHGTSVKFIAEIGE